MPRISDWNRAGAHLERRHPPPPSPPNSGLSGSFLEPRETARGGGLALDFTHTFINTGRDTTWRTERDFEQHSERDTAWDDINDQIQQDGHKSEDEEQEVWALPSYHSLEENQQSLNEQLELIMGKRLDLQFDAHSADAGHERVLAVMNAFSYLLHCRRRDIRRIEEIQQNANHIGRENERYRNRITILESDLEEERKMVMELNNRAKAKEVAFNKEKSTLREEKRSFELKYRHLVSVDQQYKAKIKKEEDRYAKLQNMLKERERKSTRGLDLTRHVLNDENCVKDARNGAGWRNNTGNTNSHMQQMLVEAYETKQTELVKENEFLRTSYKEAYGELKKVATEFKAYMKLLNARQRKGLSLMVGGDSERNQSAEVEVDVEIDLKLARNASVFQLPLDRSKSNFVTEFKRKLDLVQEKVDSMKAVEKQLAESEETVTASKKLMAVQQSLREAKRVIQDQDSLLRDALECRPWGDTPTHGGESYPPCDAEEELGTALELVEIERSSLRLKRKNLEQERETIRKDHNVLQEVEAAYGFFSQLASASKHTEHTAYWTPSKPPTRARNGPYFQNTDSSPRQSELCTDKPDTETREEVPLPLLIPATPATKKLLQKIGKIDFDQCLSPINIDTSAPR